MLAGSTRRRHSELRRRGRLPASLLGLLLSLLVSGVGRAREVPYLTGRVQDEAGLLDGAARTRLEDVLETLEKETGAQVAVLTVDSLEGDPLEDFSIRVVETWQLGREGVDDGVLVLLARDDRKVRIEVGYGLEGALPDAAARRVIDGLMTPRFRSGDFAGGLEAGVGAVAGAIRGEADAIPPPEETGADTGDYLGAAGFVLVFLLPFLRVAVALRGAGGWVVFGFLALFFFVFSVPFGFRVAVGVLLGYLLVFGLLRILLPKRWRFDGSGGGSSGGGWTTTGGGGGFSGGGFSGGGFSGGGFSGGGGSFGGGGASGSW